MDKLPVLYVSGHLEEDLAEQDGGIVMRLAKYSLVATKRTVAERHGFVEYIPAKRCETCARYNPPTKGNPAYGWCHSVRDELERVPSDGSGFCHNHEDAA